MLPFCARIMETFHEWLACMNCNTLLHESFCNSGNSEIKPHYFPRVYLISIVCRCLGVWRVGVFAQAAWAARVHKHAHVQSPSAPPSNHPPTHKNSHKCKHRHKMPINPRRNWHWRTLKELHRFVFLHGDRFLC